MRSASNAQRDSLSELLLEEKMPRDRLVGKSLRDSEKLLRGFNSRARASKRPRSLWDAILRGRPTTELAAVAPPRTRGTTYCAGEAGPDARDRECSQS